MDAQERSPVEEVADMRYWPQAHEGIFYMGEETYYNVGTMEVEHTYQQDPAREFPEYMNNALEHVDLGEILVCLEPAEHIWVKYIIEAANQFLANAEYKLKLLYKNFTMPQGKFFELVRKDNFDALKTVTLVLDFVTKSRCTQAMKQTKYDAKKYFSLAEKLFPLIVEAAKFGFQIRPDAVGKKLPLEAIEFSFALKARSDNDDNLTIVVPAFIDSLNGNLPVTRPICTVPTSLKEKVPE